VFNIYFSCFDLIHILHSSSCDVWSQVLCSICSKSIFSDLIRLIYCIQVLVMFGVKFCVHYVQNPFIYVLILFMYMLNRFIQVLGCLSNENWFWIYSELFKSYQSSSKSIQRLTVSYQSSSGIIWFDSKIVWFLSIFMTTQISHFTLLNRFKTLLIRFKPIFQCYFGSNLLISNSPIYILLLAHFSNHWVNFQISLLSLQPSLSTAYSWD